MIRGVSREIIEVAEVGNPYFERAVLFVRPGLTNRESEVLAAQGAKYIEDITKNTHSTHRRGFGLNQPLLMSACALGGAGITYLLTILL